MENAVLFETTIEGQPYHCHVTASKGVMPNTLHFALFMLGNKPVSFEMTQEIADQLLEEYRYALVAEDNGISY